ncbi:ATP-binding protein [Kribbella sp. NPDC056861]|uniref:ATP-binding protein n=1 Tax=Kribbella sp. NPDC056861 TaxID=3154857 RepID=UPI003429D6DD
MTQTAQDAARELMDGRVRALKPALAAVSKKFDAAGESELLRAIGDANRNDRPILGLLLAEKILQRAFITGSMSALADFVFRFAIHLKASVGIRGLTPVDRLALATGSSELLNITPKLRRHKDEVDNIIERLPNIPDDRVGWRRQFAMDHEDFHLRIGIFTAALRSTEKTRHDPHTPIMRPAFSGAKSTGDSIAPPWLKLSVSREDTFAEGGRNWPALSSSEEEAFDLAGAWRLFEEANYTEAQRAIWNIFASVGATWGPNSSPDGARAWNWLRLLWLLAQEEEDSLRNRRRALLSAIEAAKRSVPANETLTNWLADEVLRDYVAATPAMQSNWAVHTARTIFAVDADALAIYDNVTKVKLREAWQLRFGSIVDNMRQTHQMIEAIESEFRFKMQDLITSAQPDPLVHRRLLGPLRRIEIFLDDDEQKVTDSALRLMPLISAYLAKDDILASDSSALISEIKNLLNELSTCESLLLQDALGPAFFAILDACSQRHDELSSGSRPNIIATLLSSRLPLSSHVRAPFTIDIALRNDGNAPAELIEVALSSSDLHLEKSIQLVERIEPGAERLIHYTATSHSEESSVIQISCELTWRDPLEQTFSAIADLRAEDQRSAAWRPDDINPFKLGTISTPDRLVGRDDDLDALERVMAGGGSAAVTGLKRVGKTSLAKTLAARLRGDGWATEYLPLGQVLTGKPAAAELVVALTESIYDAVLDAWQDVLIPEPPQASASSNFARTSGRWLRQSGNILTARNLHVLIALDDFDELPRSLYEGPEADALFLFLRSIIDEPWLSLMFIGSEVLPAIISAQAHKLNQVTPYVVSNFQSVEATRELLKDPTNSRLEWQSSAYSRAHFLSGGNPYYLTLLGQEVWQRMRDLDRTYVSSGEVDDAMQRVAESAPATHFMHLWTDSIAGLDSRSRHSLMTGAVLRGIAQASGASFTYTPIKDAVEIASASFVGSSGTELTTSVRSLIDRGVVLSQEKTLRLSIPLASAWLRSAGGRELDRQFALEHEANAQSQSFSSSDLINLTRDVTFASEPISEIRLKAWLEQFPPETRHFAFLLAERLLTEGFFSNTRMTQEVLPALKLAITGTSAWSNRKTDSGGYGKNAYVLQHGIGGASSHAVATTLTKMLRIKKTNVVNLEKFLEATKNISSTCILIIADDLAGTGSQLRGVASEAVAQFSSLSGPWRENLHIIVAAGVSAVDHLWEPDDIQAESVVAVRLGSRLRAFDKDASIFDSSEDIEIASDAIDAIGRSLSPKAARGFGDLGLLVATENNCPNNTLPVIWKGGRHAGRQWMPLLERRF